ncbi:MAG: sugar ABC transporter substrate-binding protein [Burkholderiales bacterium]
MKKVTTYVLVLMMLAIFFAGCASQNPVQPSVAPSVTASTGDEETSQPTAQTPEVTPPAHYKMTAMASSEEPIEIKFLSYSNNPFWDQINEGLAAATDYLKNFNCTVTPVDMGDEADGKSIADYIETLMLEEPAAIVCCPMSDGTEAYIDKAVNAGITVVTYLSESTNQTNTRIAFSGSDATAGGEAAAQAIADFTKGEGSVGVITGYLTMNQHEERRLSMTNKLAELCPNIKILEPVEAHDSATETYDAAVNLITANPDLKAIYCTAGGPFGAAQAVKDQGKTGQIGVVCFDWVPDNVTYVASGEIVAAVSQDPQAMAFNAIIMAYNNVVTGWKPDDPKVLTESDILTPQNLKEKLPDYQG